MADQALGLDPARLDVPEQLLADRMDVLEDRLGGVLSAPVRVVGARRTAERIRSDPLPLFGAALIGALVANRLLR